MKYLFTEDSIKYKDYKFGYSVNCVLDNSDNIEKAFSMGFLPYTGNINASNEVYYMARSIRINLDDYERLSENKRIIKSVKSKFNIKVKLIDKEDFDHSIDFKKFCINYSKERFINEPLSLERLDLIISRNNYNKIFKFSIDGIDIGYVLVYHNKNIMHYWFSFYDVKYLNDFPIGKFIMEKVIFYAKKNKMSFIYLGTCYGKKALYKVRDFKGIEYFDGNKWESNIKNLKELCKNDSV
mgnify:FL=1|tara:strand:- start:259 stop:975 length:717 start_codon:yes stop_codon:yes gene_type:complete